jgi:hypothetical protein
MSIRTRLLAIPDEVIRLTLFKSISGLRWTRLMSDCHVSQYEVFFRVANGSEGHANVYVVKTERDGTLVITGQIADRCDSVRAIENDHDLAFALGRFWLLRNGHLRAAVGDIHHFTADLDSGELVSTWREGEIRGWKPFPYRVKYISQIEDRFTVILCDYRGMRAARRCAKPVPTAYLMALATSINHPIKCNDVAGQRKPVPSSTVPRRMTFMPARALKALWNSGFLFRRIFSSKIVPAPSGPMAR